MTAPAAATGTGHPAPAAPSSGGTGFCRVTVVAPDGRVDVALPEDIPVADLYPEILRLSGQSPAQGAPVGYHLVRRDGTVLDSARSLASQRILDGELLSLRPFAESLPPAVFDDVSDAVASAVARDRTLWNDSLMRGAGLFGGSVLLVLLAFVLWTADPRHDMHGLPGILATVTGVLLLALAGVRARVYDDRASSVALGIGSMANAAVAGAGLLPLAQGQGIGKLQFLLACAAVLIASVILMIVAPGGDGPFVAFVFAASVGLLVTFAAITTRMEPAETAAVCASLAVGALAFLPGLSTRFARLPIGFEPPRTAVGEYGTDPVPQGPVDAERIAAMARRGHELLVGLVGGCALVALGAAAVLGFSGNVWGQLLALATGIAMLMRAHLFRYTAQVGCALAAGLGALTLLGLGLCLNPPRGLMADALKGDAAALDIRTVWLTAAVAGLAAVITAIGLIVPRKGVTPFWGRSLEIAEAFVLLTLVPLCLAVFDVYHSIRAMTS
ncbi:type VII secretion integral membrane protein EccD [Streptomyces lunaelactis]|uniref:type VII secretion integral membrane protein EccD n=1 Tax=Streptomyces lunaelactis TaxID=1535768 RepID=UPI00158485A8|nr:type VII secretion integral membrane protein EccD [Streptomyces lunaelactis]NUK37281.1 type VII secretion integral membrane protein EccD [Streptomyces lunaelactis]NUK43951.1 type VII secretion integral membrane protein EccD [Streptomyces lunaelactis]NUK53415.1 type VII secretion integral membrane protein EccD [Streptomyces lunaelactis]NUK67102.1 type VII secretion integral membrane protein EccD [Streptomyces lunaelactis]NUK94536.1 type VII secretion integral membrane protein EccD [Streptomy